MNANWSDELVSLTRSRVSAMQWMAPEARHPLCMKNWDDRFGLLTFSAATPGALIVIDRKSGLSQEFESLDTLVTAGWALD